MSTEFYVNIWQLEGHPTCMGEVVFTSRDDAARDISDTGNTDYRGRPITYLATLSHAGMIDLTELATLIAAEDKENAEIEAAHVRIESAALNSQRL